MPRVARVLYCLRGPKHSVLGNEFAGEVEAVGTNVSAVGTAALQLARHLGAHVTAVGYTARLGPFASLGADRVIDYTREDFTSAGQDYDFVYDAVGKSSFRACRPLLKPGGIYCSSEPGFWCQNPALAIWTSRFGARKVIVPIPKTGRRTWPI